MKKFFRRRGQATVEFVLLLPFFAMVLFATIYIGMFVLDYVTLDNQALESARAAARADDHKIPAETRNKAKNTELFFPWYTVADTSPTSTVDGDYVTVTITANLKDSKKSGTLLGDILPEAYTVSKTVRVES